MRHSLKIFSPSALILLAAALAVAGVLVYREIETSTYQARRLSGLANGLRWEIKDGPDGGLSLLRQEGPYDLRMGYSRLPE
ncbi:MAG TPA: hypothetical protein VJ734_09130, partial [Nitrosospira sp.]|nr:hypothetical protein [Nitrosospira sp.]